MNINRHNYESFFLLYIDNELSVQERNALELFVEENADLQEELDMLKQSIVKADDTVFKGKNKLFKPEIILPETAEQLLLYIDGELTIDAAEQFELVLSNNESLITQLQLFQQTKLSPTDKIIFVNKELLYRQEKNKVIPFGWWKLAVAAGFIGIGIWSTSIYLTRKSSIAINETAHNNPVSPIKKIKNVSVNISPVEIAITTTPPTSKAEKSSIKKVVTLLPKLKNNLVLLHENKSLAIEQKIQNQPDNHLPKPYFENINNTGSNKNELANVTSQTLQNTIDNNNISAKVNKVKPAETNNNVYTAVFTNKSDENKEDRFTFSDDEPKKSKLSGFLRKAKRVLERNTKMKSGDDNVKVANLEFAIQ